MGEESMELVVLLEGSLIVGSFSCVGAYIAKAYRFDRLVIGLVMTTFGLRRGRHPVPRGRRGSFGLSALLPAKVDRQRV